MCELEIIRDQYLEGAKNLHQISCKIIEQDSTKISTKKIEELKRQLTFSYNELLEIDCNFSKKLRIRGGYSDSHPDTSSEEFVLMNRSFFISNLEKLEKEVINIENAKQFRLTIKIALFAIVVSTLGILLPTIIRLIF